MKPATLILTAALVAVIAAYSVVKITAPKQTVVPAVVQTEKKLQSVFDKVAASKTIRCGYVVYAPYFMKDSNTGKFSGIFYDLTEEMGKALNVKIDWAYETTFGTFVEDMNTDRYDVLCGGLWPEAVRSFFIDYSVPVNYVGLGVYVRADDMRFDGNVMALNDKQYKFSTLDGEMADFVAKTDFPNAEAVSHPHNTDISQLILAVTTKKADATVVEKAVAEKYLQSNPGTIKNLTEQKPIRVFANTWGVKKGETKMLSVLNTAITELVNMGVAERIVKKYEEVPNSFYAVAKPYEVK
jgi:ABC-type amino acid transport substrate-binding protein